MNHEHPGWLAGVLLNIMAKIIYPTTRPGWYDTRAIAKGKWLQQKNSPSTAGAGLLAKPDSTKPKHSDTKLITLQKILTVEQLITGIKASLLVGLVSHWKFDDLNYQDSVGTNHLTGSGAPTLTDGMFGGQAVLLNPVNSDWLSIASNAGLNGQTDFTFAGWIYPNEVGANNCGIIAKQLTNKNQYALAIASNSLRAETWHVNTSYNGTGIHLGSNAWHFFVWTYQKKDDTLTSTNVLLVDNSFTVANAGMHQVPNEAGVTLRIGARKDDNQLFDGRIQSFSLWNRLLTSDEKSYLYNSGYGRSYPF